VTEQDKPRFLQCLNRLAVAFRVRETVDPVLTQVYFDTLADWPIQAVEDAGAELQRSGGSFFPTTAAWYEEAARIAKEDAARARRLENERATLAWVAAQRALPPDPDEAAKLAALREETIQRMAEVQAKLIMNGVKPARFRSVHDNTKQAPKPCPECGATSREFVHRGDCSRGVRKPESAVG